MAQFIEVTEKEQNGISNVSPITKSYVVHNIESAQPVDVNGVNDTIIFLGGRKTKDVRRVDEEYVDVIADANAAPSADVERILDLTIKAKQGDLEERITPYSKGILKNQVVEFYADPNDAADSIVVVKVGDNNAERIIYTVDEDYAAIKASFDA